ncbi:MAG: hypothetical protein ACMG51_08150 [Ginsengibacter sp.]
MKRKRILQKIFLNEWSYKLFSPFIYVANRLQASRINFKESYEKEILFKEASEIFNEKKILNGPFKGLHFYMGNTGASSIFAKILGSYESEIHSFINRTLQNSYQNLINIGSDDGYYAVGYAVKNPGLNIFAFDSNKKAWADLKKNAEANGVEDRIRQAGLFTSRDLSKFNDGQRNLFIVDCEGAEKEIFSAGNISGLLNADLIIELHLHLYPELEKYFRVLFEDTHYVEIIDSIPDYLKAARNNYSELSKASFSLKKYITAEREIFMQWLFLISKKNTLKQSDSKDKNL